MSSTFLEEGWEPSFLGYSASVKENYSGSLMTDPQGGRGHCRTPTGKEEGFTHLFRGCGSGRDRLGWEGGRGCCIMYYICLFIYVYLCNTYMY